MKLLYYIDQYWDDIADQRVNNWALINGGIWRIGLILIGYMFVTQTLLPRFMKYRDAYKLHNTLLVYNTIMVVLNAYYFLLCVYSLDYGNIFLDFNYPSTDDNSESNLNLLSTGWNFMLTRYLDWADTVFFVLRKKQSQISFLHLYHHSVVPLLAWFSFKYNATVPGIRLFVMLNTLIHVIMYGYYALSSLGPRIQKYLWWKRYLTLMQISQFVIFGMYAAILLFNHTNYPFGYFLAIAGQVPVFLYLFGDFYLKSYRRNVSLKFKAT